MHTFCKKPSSAPSVPFDNSLSNIDEEYHINLKLLLAYKELIRPSTTATKRHPSAQMVRNQDSDDEKSIASSISSGFVNDFVVNGIKKTPNHSSIDSISVSSESTRVNNLKCSSDPNNNCTSPKPTSKQIHRRSTEPPSPNKLPSLDIDEKRRSVLLIKNQLENMQSGSEFCHSCEKRVYPFERTSTGEKTYHKSCFRCSVCKRTLLPGNFAALEGTIFCKPHYIEKFRIRGKYETQSTKPAADVVPMEKAVVE